MVRQSNYKSRSHSEDIISSVSLFKRMKLIKFLALMSLFILADSRPSNEATSVNCLMDYLREKNKLDSDFPSTNSGIALCSTAMTITVSAVKDKIEGSIKEKPELKSTCLIDSLNQENFMDDFILRDLIVTSNLLNEEKREEKFKVVQAKLKKTLEDAAKKCDSDPAYAGLFGEILQIKNETMPVLIHNYCTTKFVKDSNLISLENVEENPNNIDTTNINCDEIIENLKDKNEAKVRKDLRAESISESAINCIVKKQKAAKMYDIAIALEVNDRVVTSLAHKKRNIELLTEKVSGFGSILTCFF
jgi:hypothetical protein